MNKLIGVGDSKYVIVFDPVLTSHVIRRMRSGSVRISNANQWEPSSHARTVEPHKKVAESLFAEGREITHAQNRNP